MTTKVKLRKKVITGKRQSLYLDFYPAIKHPKTGEPTRREFLGLYLFDNAKTPIDKQANKETLQLGEQIRQKRDNELNKPEVYSGYEKEQLKIKEKSEHSFIEYFKELADKRQTSNHDNWISAYHYIEKFSSGKLKFVDLNEKFCNDFRHYLLTTPSNKSSKTKLSQNSALSYFNKLKATLKQAYKDGYLLTDLNAKIERIKEAETHRNFLTIQELNKLAKTDCPNSILKNSALFSALTGLRFSDIKKLVWGDFEFIKGQGNFIKFKQQKTKGVEMMPISKQALGLLGKRKHNTDKVFAGLNDRDRYYYFAVWVAKAGITKELTFHCLRHTFATLQLSKGTDIYTVSKMLGHRELKTTQVYACQNKVHSSGGRIYGDYCKNRFCPLCSGIRKAEIIHNYWPVIKTWKNPHFVTLTLQTVPANQLKKRVNDMLIAFRKIKDKFRKWHTKGESIKLIGIKSLECNFNPVKKWYNPHFHLIVPNKATGNIIIQEWRKYWGFKMANPKGQNIEEIYDPEKCLIEVVKYFSKIFTDPEMKKRGEKKIDPKIYVSAFDNIIWAMKGHRIFGNFGFNLPKSNKNKGTFTEKNEYDQWQHDPKQTDWFNIDDPDQLLTGYVLTAELLKLLEENIDMVLE